MLCIAVALGIGGTHGLDTVRMDRVLISDVAGRTIQQGDRSSGQGFAPSPTPQERAEAGVHAAMADRPLATMRGAPPLLDAETTRVLSDSDIAIRAEFILGYRAAGGNPAWEGHFVNVVIPCESAWRLDPPGYFLGVAQFHPDTWERAGGGDWTDAYTQGANVARWSSRTNPETQWTCWE